MTENRVDKKREDVFWTQRILMDTNNTLVILMLPFQMRILCNSVLQNGQFKQTK